MCERRAILRTAALAFGMMNSEVKFLVSERTQKVMTEAVADVADVAGRWHMNHVFFYIQLVLLAASLFGYFEVSQTLIVLSEIL